MRLITIRPLLILASIALPAVVLAFAGQADDMNHEAIQYLKTQSSDAVVRLQERIDSGAVKLDYDPEHGYLRAVLKNLGIPASSQMLVFSKTSFQRQVISPRTPRALYFNDSTYVGWIPGAPVMEITSVDPQLGAVFYVLRQEPQARPKFARQSYECLQCHSGSMTQGIPGHIVRSIYPRPDGEPELRAGSHITTYMSPLNERWGGWYVTGTHGTQRHMGNAFLRGPGEGYLDPEQGANITDLADLLDTSAYISRHSDITALMALEHQTYVQNLITRANYLTRIALNYEAALTKELGEPAGTRLESTRSRIKSAVEPLVKALLFSSEARIEQPIQGTSGFATEFASWGTRDRKGRSLRDLDLKTRMMRYPCSWVIYSPAIDGLPDPARDYLFSRMQEILSGKDTSKDFAHLSDSDRTAIAEILRDTKPSIAGRI